MRISRIYYSGELKDKQRVQLDSSASAHLVRVLRIKAGTDIILFNGNGNDYHCQTLDENVRNLDVEIKSCQPNQTESPLNITLVQGISKSHRMEFCIQKATELGVQKIVPVICQRSNIRFDQKRIQKKLTHWQNVAISACEQSGRATIPEVTPLQTLTDYLLSNSRHNCLFMTPDAKYDFQTNQLHQSVSKDPFISLLIGPEGGFNQSETELLKSSQWQAIKMGPRILRTETAGPAAIAVMQSLWGDFSGDYRKTTT